MKLESRSFIGAAMFLILMAPLLAEEPEATGNEDVEQVSAIELTCGILSPAKDGSEAIYCQDVPDPQAAPPPQACDSLQLLPGTGIVRGQCIQACNTCDFTARQRIAVDRQLDAICDQMCRNQGTCPPGKTCVRDRVVNQTTVPSCIPASNFCQAPTPDLCVKIERIGECTCKCV